MSNIFNGGWLLVRLARLIFVELLNLNNKGKKKSENYNQLYIIIEKNNFFFVSVKDYKSLWVSNWIPYKGSLN